MLEPFSFIMFKILHFSLQLDYSLMETQALVLGPTRELAQQIEKARVLI